MCKIGWTEFQDQLLIHLKEDQLIQSWRQIGQNLNKNVSGKNRTGKQCRERYINHLKQEIKKQGWDKAQEEKLFQLYKIHGSHWTLISKQMEGRTQNFIKNKFYGSIRKITRFINRIFRQKQQKKSKPIKYESILRVIQIAEEGWDSHPQIKIQSEELRQKVFQIILLSEENFEKINGLIKEIHQFNLKTRCFGIKKKKAIKPKSKEEINEDSQLKSENGDSYDSIQYLNKDNMAEEEFSFGKQTEIELQQNGRIWQNLFIEEKSDNNDLLRLPPLPNKNYASKIQSIEEFNEEFSQIIGSSLS